MSLIMLKEWQLIISLILHSQIFWQHMTHHPLHKASKNKIYNIFPYTHFPKIIGFAGVWGIYSFDERKERYSYASDIEEGLFLFSLDDYEEPVAEKTNYLALFFGFTTFLFGIALGLSALYIYKQRKSTGQFQHLNEIN